MAVDPTKGWEHLWQNPDVIRRGWSQPSPVVVNLAERVWRNGARRAWRDGRLTAQTCLLARSSS